MPRPWATLAKITEYPDGAAPESATVIPPAYYGLILQGKALTRYGNLSAFGPTTSVLLASLRVMTHDEPECSPSWCSLKSTAPAVFRSSILSRLDQDYSQINLLKTSNRRRVIERYMDAVKTQF